MELKATIDAVRYLPTFKENGMLFMLCTDARGNEVRVCLKNSISQTENDDGRILKSGENLLWLPTKQ